MSDTSYKLDPPKSSKEGNLKRNEYCRIKRATALMGKIIFRILSDFASTQISLMKRENTLLSLYPTPAPINIVLKSKSLNGSPWILRYVKKVSHKMGRLEGWNSACVSVRTWVKIPKIHVMPDAVVGICRAGVAKPTVEEERSQSPGTYKQAILEYAVASELGPIPKYQMRPWSLNSDFSIKWGSSCKSKWRIKWCSRYETQHCIWL